MRVSQTRVVVTGATRGIGRGIVDAIVEEGGQVLAVGRDAEALEELAAHPRVAACAVDLTDADAVARIMAAADDPAYSEVRGLVNCAGLLRFEPLAQISPTAVHEQLQVNLVAPLLLAKELGLEFAERGGGAIVNISSTLAERGAPGTLVYAATKAALNAVTLGLAQELAQDRVRVNAVLPGVVETDMVRSVRGPADVPPDDAQIEAQLESFRRLHPLGRLGQPADIARVVIGLLDHPWQTGSLITVDGGLLVRG